MIRVIQAGSASTQYANPQYKTPIKYYNNKVTKEEIKEDFGIILEREIQKLKIDVLIWKEKNYGN